jgi:hypothetical protein
MSIRMDKQGTGWKWRDNQLTMKEFYNLPQQERDDYILLVRGLKVKERSSMDVILLNRFGDNKISNTFTLNEE